MLVNVQQATKNSYEVTSASPVLEMECSNVQAFEFEG